ncbi:PspC domain-containing protein [Flavobacterium sp. CYK-4]|uniref:PspC domain-containing protein n=1 Tax=Flavobacterium lotistagni TaxID=2709660 RepID=UPI00140DCC70|nr:PspC domain-containing protein [Flavobacterium lotistagni]NHM06315.1 PspC domain-containing protein [Flavobacterium lotistagni]
MNKTVNINLGGMFFHIDEDAFQKLTRYFDAIKRSLSSSNGQDEILKDIEMRIAELVAEKHTNDKQVINLRELDEIIAVMGQPEDYRIEPDGDEPQQQNYDFTNNNARANKKLYRDKDTGMIGGVAAGLGHYFGIDAVWLRIILVVLVFGGFGSGIIAYIVLWIVMPEAVTTSEKLEMKGEPITISNIEKKVKEEFESVSEKFKNANYDKMGNQVKTGVDKFTGTIGEVFMTIFKVFAKVLGVILILSSLSWLVILFIGVFTLGSSAFIDFPWQSFIEAGNFSDYPVWVFGLIIFLAMGIPFFFLLLLGFKLLSPGMKSVNNGIKYTLLALWLVAIGILISIGIRQATEYAVDGRFIQKSNLPVNMNDTLYVKFKSNDYFSNGINDRSEFLATEDSLNNKVIYSNEVRLYIMKTDEKTPYIQIDRKAKGSSLAKAKKTAEQIKYGYTFANNRLVLDNYLLTDFKNKWRDQEVEIYLYLPAGTLLKPDASVQDYDDSDDSYFNLHFSSDNYIYKVGTDKVKCLNCPPEENEWDDVEGGIKIENDSTTTSVTLNKDGILIKKDQDETESREVKSVKINEDGITIKTK